MKLKKESCHEKIVFAFLLVFASCFFVFGTSQKSFASYYCNGLSLYEDVMSLPYNCDGYTVDSGMAINFWSESRNKWLYEHIYWNSGVSGYFVTYNPGNTWVIIGADHGLSNVFSNISLGGVYNPAQYGIPTNLTWEEACAAFSTSDPSIVMTNTVTSETCYGPLPATPLSFPFSGYTAYTAEVSSAMDHSIPSGAYTQDGIVLAFNGEEGDVDNGCWCYSTSSVCTSGNYTSCSVAGFKNSGGTNFLDGVIDYDDVYLYYDGHPGYDYPESQYTNINAPADGILCVATPNTTAQNPADVWRNTTYCPYATADAGSTTWSGYHTFYIIHEGLYINGSTDDYMTVFLHSDDLESSVMDDIETNGYAEVSQNQHIAEVGDIGSSGAYHMHFEVYKWNDSTSEWDLVDPYGDGTNDILWE